MPSNESNKCLHHIPWLEWFLPPSAADPFINRFPRPFLFAQVKKLLSFYLMIAYLHSYRIPKMPPS